MSEQTITIQAPKESDWIDMSDEYGWGANDYVLNTPLGKYSVGKRVRRDDTTKWWFTDNINYHYAISGREYDSKAEAMNAAWEHYKSRIVNHSFTRS